METETQKSGSITKREVVGTLGLSPFYFRLVLKDRKALVDGVWEDIKAWKAKKVS